MSPALSEVYELSKQIPPPLDVFEQTDELYSFIEDGEEVMFGMLLETISSNVAREEIKAAGQ